MVRLTPQTSQVNGFRTSTITGWGYGAAELRGSDMYVMRNEFSGSWRTTRKDISTMRIEVWAARCPACDETMTWRNGIEVCLWCELYPIEGEGE